MLQTIAHTLAAPQIRGCHESRVPAALTALADLSCTARVADRHLSVPPRVWALSQFSRHAVAARGYLSGSPSAADGDTVLGLVRVIMLVELVPERSATGRAPGRGVWALVLPQAKKAVVVVAMRDAAAPRELFSSIAEDLWEEVVAEAATLVERPPLGDDVDYRVEVRRSGLLRSSVFRQCARTPQGAHARSAYLHANQRAQEQDAPTAVASCSRQTAGRLAASCWECVSAWQVPDDVNDGVGTGGVCARRGRRQGPSRIGCRCAARRHSWPDARHRRGRYASSRSAAAPRRACAARAAVLCHGGTAGRGGGRIRAGGGLAACGAARRSAARRPRTGVAQRACRASTLRRRAAV